MRKATGRNDNQTAPTAVDPADWIESLPKPRQVEQGRAMLRLFGEVTGEPARMWGSSMVGYGHQRPEGSQRAQNWLYSQPCAYLAGLAV